MNTKNINTHLTEIRDYFKAAISIDCVIFGFDEDVLKVLLIESDLNEFKGKWSLLGDIVRPDEDLEEAAYRVLRERTGLEDVYMEQVQAFGAIDRHPAGRVISIAFYSLVNIGHVELKTHNNDLHWHAVRDISHMAFDHREILATCYQRLQHKVIEQPIGFNLLPKKFSLRELQNLYEAILDVKLDRRNFRKKFFAMDYLVDLNEEEQAVKHRPARLYKFNQEKYSQRQKKSLGF
ncbi:NUDIX domain-containing protein [Chitinophaga sp. XS-30]|uniref:NUDIX hydrolase n=1 Tax=Chitinophaga sp. XS-30 TaxID=2604421 RepID=UPI0011DD6812|nr:NUDIX domain-containing protein [Chitinophaga sp. XS-30]QEH39779.1 NUDIX domain-containing protein [Chitinophaga sp. XS-30]